MTEGGVTSWSSASTSCERAAARWTVTFTWEEDFHLFPALLEFWCYRKYSKRLKKDNHFYLGSRLWLCAVVLLLSTSVKKSFVCCVTWFPCAALFLVFKSKVFSYLARRVVPRKNGANIVERNLKCSIINLVIWMKLVETLWVFSFSWILAFISVKIACMFLLLPVGHQSFSANRQFSAYRVALLLKHHIYVNVNALTLMYWVTLNQARLWCLHKVI